MRTHVINTLLSIFAVILHPTMLTHVDPLSFIRNLKKWARRQTAREVFIHTILMLPALLVISISIAESKGL